MKSISYEFEDKDKETFTLFHPLEIKSESESSLLTVYSLKYSEWKDYEFKRISYTYQQKNELVRVIYDVRLKNTSLIRSRFFNNKTEDNKKTLKNQCFFTSFVKIGPSLLKHG